MNGNTQVRLAGLDSLIIDIPNHTALADSYFYKNKRETILINTEVNHSCEEKEIS